MTKDRGRWLRLSIVSLLGLTMALGLGLELWYWGPANRPSTVPAAGLITLNGVPVANAFVTFSPTDATGFPAAGPTDGRGRFVLSTFTANDGCCPGRYDVTITMSSQPKTASEPVVVTDLLPAKSSLTTDVGVAGGNFTFDLVD